MRLPNCDFCKHFHKNKDDKMCCDAFPTGIPPEKITWGNETAECANGIKYEKEGGLQGEFVPEKGSLLEKMYRI